MPVGHALSKASRNWVLVVLAGVIGFAAGAIGYVMYGPGWMIALLTNATPAVAATVMALLVEPEPLLPIRAVKHRVADAPREAMDGDGVTREPHGGDGRGAHDDGRKRQPDPSRPPAGAYQVQRQSPLPAPPALPSARSFQSA